MSTGFGSERPVSSLDVGVVRLDGAMASMVASVAWVWFGLQGCFSIAGESITEFQSI